MLLLYCLDPLARGQPDAAFVAEVRAAESLGLPLALINFEALVDMGDPSRAVRGVPAQPESVVGLYRGWMLRPEQYTQLYAALLERNVRLINDPAAYRHCHYLPESYPRIAQYSPRTVWLPLAPGRAPSREVLRNLLASFGSRPLIVKDYVKSRKHEWLTACFISSAADMERVEDVVHHFLELQGDDLAAGLVFREYVAFVPLAAHSQSGMPLTCEYRTFWLDGDPIVTAPYWDEGDYAGSEPPLTIFRQIAAGVASRFFTMDVAQRAEDLTWQIVELGDGQVSGIPERADIRLLYEALARHLS